MNFPNFVKRLSPSTLVKTLSGASPDLVINDNLMVDFSHGMEATLSLLSENNDGKISARDLGVDLDFEFIANGKTVSLIRDCIFAALEEASARRRAAASDCSKEFVPEVVDTSSKIMLIGNTKEFRPLFKGIGLPSLETMSLSNCPMALAPRQSGDVCGIEGTLVDWDHIREGMVHLIDEAIMSADRKGHHDFAVADDDFDFSDLLGYATSDEKQRIVALSEQAGIIEDLRSGFRYRGLLSLMMSRISNNIESLKYGSMQYKDNNDPVLWHYSTHDNEALDAALLSIIGFDQYSNVPIADRMFNSLRVVYSGDALTPVISLHNNYQTLYELLDTNSFPQMIVYDTMSDELNSILNVYSGRAISLSEIDSFNTLMDVYETQATSERSLLA